MIKTANSEEEQRIAGILEKHLRNFPLAEESHRIQVMNRQNNISVAYLTTKSNLRFDQRHFDLQIEGSECYIVTFGVDQSRKRQGFGKALYQVVENFTRELGIKKILTDPSGEGKMFWPKMGLEKYDSANSLQKLI